MTITIPDELLLATRMNEAEIRQELSVHLFSREKLTMGQAVRLSGMDRLSFQHLLASRRIPVHYDVEELEEDIKTLRKLNLHDRRQ